VVGDAVSAIPIHRQVDGPCFSFIDSSALPGPLPVCTVGRGDAVGSGNVRD